ncbi:MAG TPA: hypothetical protein VEG44_10395 [Candidatus Acidoferrales bacterium]|nr:hypothetical protein [Candidatus Acidoferrales bacterium]
MNHSSHEGHEGRYKMLALYFMKPQDKNMSMSILFIPLLNGEHPIISGTASPTSGGVSGFLSSSLFRSSSSHRRFRSSLVLKELSAFRATSICSSRQLLLCISTADIHS